MQRAAVNVSREWRDAKAVHTPHDRQEGGMGHVPSRLGSEHELVQGSVYHTRTGQEEEMACDIKHREPYV